MADQEDDQTPGEPAMSQEMAAFMQATRDRLAAREGARSASEALTDETTRRPFSMRLTAMEMCRLRKMALAEGEGATELARRLMLEGLLRLEAQHLEAPGKARLADVIAHLNAQVDATRRLVRRLTEGDAPPA